jgi:hypothetical protein
MHFRLITILFLLILQGTAIQAKANEDVGLELVLLADATGSIDDAEIRFQREGYARAITDPAVIAAISNAFFGRIAVTYVEWGNSISQDVVVDWTIIDSLPAAEKFVEKLLAAPRKAFGFNAIGSALLLGKSLIENNDLNGFRKVIDISADSANNWDGPDIEFARDEVVNAGITINGLAVLCRACSGRPIDYDLELAFSQLIVGGAGAFVITADSSATFANAVRRKLILEISGLSPPNKMARNGTKTE